LPPQTGAGSKTSGPAETYDVPGVDAQAAEQGFVAVGAPPLVSEAQRLVDVLKLHPHAATHGPAPTNQKKQSQREGSDGFHRFNRCSSDDGQNICPDYCDQYL